VHAVRATSPTAESPRLGGAAFRFRSGSLPSLCAATQQSVSRIEPPSAQHRGDAGEPGGKISHGPASSQAPPAASAAANARATTSRGPARRGASKSSASAGRTVEQHRSGAPHCLRDQWAGLIAGQLERSGMELRESRSPQLGTDMVSQGPARPRWLPWIGRHAYSCPTPPVARITATPPESS